MKIPPFSSSRRTSTFDFVDFGVQVLIGRKFRRLVIQVESQVIDLNKRFETVDKFAD